MIADRPARRLARLAAAALCASLVVASTGANVAAAQSVPPEPGTAADLGAVTIVDARDPDRVLDRGTSTTQFSVRPPSGAACPGDSAHDQWQVQSFVIPADVDPAGLHFGVIGPDGPGQYALYRVNEDPYVHAVTLQNEGAGSPGLLAEVPPLSFAVFPDDILPSGRYRLGLACDYFRVPGRYWDTEIVIDADAGDGFGWRLASAPVDEPSGGSSRRMAVVGGVGLVVALLAVVELLRRRASSAHPPVAVTPRFSSKELQ